MQTRVACLRRIDELRFGPIILSGCPPTYPYSIDPQKAFVLLTRAWRPPAGGHLKALSANGRSAAFGRGDLVSVCVVLEPTTFTDKVKEALPWLATDMGWSADHRRVHRLASFRTRCSSGWIARTERQ
jgi:hypothetical protein